MKFLLFYCGMFLFVSGIAQNIQLHYDFRHTIDPDVNADNFPSISFEYFKNLDTVGTGSFLLKVQADLKGRNRNMGQVFVQLSQTLKFWKPKMYLSVGYSGGLGITPKAYGFYLSNALSAGMACPFTLKGAWFSVSLLYRYNAFDKPSYDPQFTFYFGKGFRNYKIFIAGSFVCWTENRNQGNEYTRGLSGKKVAFFGDPQLWVKIKGGLSVGSKINVFHHLITEDNQIQFYPTIGIKYQF